VAQPRDELGLIEASSLGESRDSVAVSRPVPWVAAAALSAVTGLLLALIVSMPAVDLVAWVLAGPVATALAAAYSWRDVQLQTHIYYTVSRPLRTFQWMVMLLCAAGVVLSALRLADWLGHR
jgi:hypothetical protein